MGETVTNQGRARSLLESERPEILLTDLKMPHVDGMQVLSRARELDPELVVIMITGHDSSSPQWTPCGPGAFDYLLTPLFPAQERIRRPGGSRTAYRQVLHSDGPEEFHHPQVVGWTDAGKWRIPLLSP